MLKAEIAATGDEILCGDLVDTNTPWLADRLLQAGLRVTRHICVGDDLDELVELLGLMASSCQVAVITGGLGPTPDDLSAKAAALASNQDLVLFEEALQSIRSFWERLSRAMPESNRKQAILPDKSQVLPNPVGTAPGFSLQIDRCRFYFLPGVPGEMKRMFSESVLPEIKARLGEDVRPMRIKVLSTFGVTESGAAEKLRGFEDRFPNIKLGYRFSFPEIHIRLYQEPAENADPELQLQQAADWVQERLGEAVFSQEGKALAEVVGDLLRARGRTLALAESCTGGYLAHLITSISGSSDYFLLSSVTYANAAKTSLLGVKAETLQRFGAVHEETAQEMALGAKRAAGADFGLSTTGIAGPSGGTADKPVGTVCIGLATPHKVLSRRFTLHYPQRSANIRFFAYQALNLLRLELIGSQSQEGHNKTELQNID